MQHQSDEIKARIPQSLDDFRGCWRLSRTINDGRADLLGHFKGEAVFYPTEQGLRLEEKGHLDYGGAELIAERVYLWTPNSTGVAVFYEDGRPFHEFAFEPSQQVEHICGPDLYKGHYTFSDWPNWSVSWCVRGPRKDYSATSQFVRLA